MELRVDLKAVRQIIDNTHLLPNGHWRHARDVGKVRYAPAVVRYGWEIWNGERYSIMASTPRFWWWWSIRAWPFEQEHRDHIRHLCEDPCCCNPAHLTIGSRAANVKDAQHAWDSPRFELIRSRRDRELRDALRYSLGA